MAGLQKAYDQIFAEIIKQIEEMSMAQGVANDPMPVENSTKMVEFIGFYDKSKNLVKDKGNLTGEKDVINGENSAEFDPTQDNIKWDLKESGYTSSVSGNVTTYIYQLVLGSGGIDHPEPLRMNHF